MESDALKVWLRKTAARDAAANLFLSLLALAAGLAVLGATFLFSYAVAWVGFNVGVSSVSQLLFNQSFHASRPLLLLLCSAFLILLFIGNALSRRDDLGAFPERKHARSLSNRGFAGGLDFLLPNGVASRAVADLLYCGPRLMSASWCAVTKTGRLMCLDLEGCSQILAALLARDALWSYEDLRDRSGVAQPARAFAQLRDLGGIVFHDTAPTGLRLSRELRDELLGATGSALPQSGRAETPGTGDTIHQLLGVPPGTTLEDIEAAYEKWIWRSRHERPGFPGQLWHEQTERQIRAMNAAYESFLRAHKPKESEQGGSRIETVWQQFKRSKSE